MTLTIFYLVYILILVYSIILHEVAHGKAAEIMGDESARMHGRISLNPIPHIDIFGLLLPVFLMISGSSVVFGWAKPVPINPYHFRDYKKGMIYVSAAGIVTNLFLAWLLATIVRFLPTTYDNAMLMAIAAALNQGIYLNILLAVFNLLPIPPLDGSRLFALLLPRQYSQYIYRLEPHGFLILVLFLLFPPAQELLWTVVSFIYHLLMLKPF